MRTRRPTSDWRVSGVFADTNTKFKKNTINVIDEGRRVGQQSTRTLTTRSWTKTQNNKNTVSVISGDKQSTDALPTLCRRVPQHKRHIRITATMKCKQVTTDASTDMLTASHLFAPQVTMVCVCIYIYIHINVWLITNLNYLFQSWVTWASLSYMCANGRYEMWTSSLDIRIPH